MKIFAFAASLRQSSLNKKLACLACDILRERPDVEIDFTEFGAFDIPLFNGDIENSSGIPEGVNRLARRVLGSDALLIASPEYNGGIAGPLKNALDWISRTVPNPVSGKPLFLMSATPGAFGGVRGLWHTRVPFDALGCFVHPEMFGLARANHAFGEDGSFTDKALQERLKGILGRFADFACAVAERQRQEPKRATAGSSRPATSAGHLRGENQRGQYQ